MSHQFVPHRLQSVTPRCRALFAQLSLLTLAGLLQSGDAAAAIRYFDITGSTAANSNACPIWIPADNQDDCSYGASNPSTLGVAEWLGPVYGAGHYAPAGAPLVFSQGPVSGPVLAPTPILSLGGKTGIPITRGFISINDRDTPETTDDIIGGTFELGAFQRNVAIAPLVRVNETFQRILHTLVATTPNVSAATPNGAGGLDYVVGVTGASGATSPAFPSSLAGSTTAGGGFADAFPSEVASLSSAATGDVRYWTAAAANGIARLDGDSGIRGVATGAAVYGYSCVSSAGACFTNAFNWDAGSRARFQNVLLRISTDAGGAITAADAVLVNEVDFSAAVAGNDSWQATTASFTGSQDQRPDAYDDQTVLTVGLDFDVSLGVLANDVPGVAPLGVTATQPAHGATVVETGNRVRYTPDNTGFLGTDTFTYTITDANNDSSTGTVSIILTDPITCTNDIRAGAADTPLVIDVLANDSGFDIPPIALTIQQAPTVGTAVVNQNRTITYTPPTGQTGFFTFTYRINDGTVTDPATCQVTANIEGTVAVDDTDTTEDFTLNDIAVLANDRRDVLTPPIEIEVVSEPTHGAVIVFPATSADLALVRYISDEDYAGPDSFTYRLRDANNFVSNVATVNLTVTDSVPVTQNDSVDVFSNCAPLAGNPPILAEDGVVRRLNVACNDTGLADAPVVLTIVTPPAHGTATVVPASGGGRPAIDYTANAGYAGPDTLSYRLTDADGDVSADPPATVAITVEDSAPVAVADTVNGDFRTDVFLFVLDNDEGLVDFPFEIEITQPPTLGTARVVPASATLTGLPDIVYASNIGAGDPTAVDTLQYRLSDSDNPADVSAPATVTINITDGVPAAVNDTRTLEDSGTAQIPVLSNDTGRNNLPITLNITQQPANGTITINTGAATALPTVTYRPRAGFTGSDSFSYTFTDADGETSLTPAVVSLMVSDSEPDAENDPLPSGQPIRGDGRLVSGSSTPDANGTAIDVQANDAGISDAPVRVVIVNPVPDAVTGIAETPLGQVRVLPVVAGVGSRDGLFFASDPNASGTETITYKLVDADGDESDTATVTIQVANDTPVAVNDRGGDQGLLPQGQTVVAERVNTAMDIVRNDQGRRNRPLSIQITQQPAHGTVRLSTPEETGLGRPGTVYRSDAGYIGPDSFRYTITDGDGQVSNVATVSFDVLSLLTATADGDPIPLATNRNVTLNNINILDNDGGTAYGLVSVEIVSEVNGSATLNADNTVSFTPDRDFLGRFPSPDCQAPVCFAPGGAGFRYRLRDARNQVAEAVVFIDVLPTETTNRGGSSALGPWSLGLLAVALALRQRRLRTAD